MYFNVFYCKKQENYLLMIFPLKRKKQNKYAGNARNTVPLKRV